METTKFWWITHTWQNTDTSSTRCNCYNSFWTGLIFKYYVFFLVISFGPSWFDETLIKGRHIDVTVSESTCECNFHSCMSLLCRHIFSFRKHKNMSSFDQCLVEPRWTKTDYKKKHVIFDGGHIGHNSGCLLCLKMNTCVFVLSWQNTDTSSTRCNCYNRVKLVTVVTFTRIQLPFQINRQKET
jgi:hypothetical protein